MDLALFGPPGAGKGTQASFLCQYFSLHSLSTGDILRAEVGEGTSLGHEVDEVMRSGALVSDEVVTALLVKQLERYRERSFLFDGYPRTEAQAQVLDDILPRYGRSLALVLSLRVPNAELMQRLSDRGRQAGALARRDDQSQVIRRRLEIFHREMQPIEEHYKQRDAFYGVDGTGSIAEVGERLAVLIREKSASVSADSPHATR